MKTYLNSLRVLADSEEMDRYSIPAEEQANGNTVFWATWSSGVAGYYIRRADGSFWTCFSNEDEIFGDDEACRAWLLKRLN